MPATPRPLAAPAGLAAVVSALLLLLTIAPSAESIKARPLELFVGGAADVVGRTPHDADADVGTAARPFVSVGGAVAAIRALPQAERCSPGGVTVTVAGGSYGGAQNRLHLTAADSGCGHDAPAIFRAAPGDSEPVVLHGGVEIPESVFKKEAAKAPGGKTVWSADLGA